MNNKEAAEKLKVPIHKVARLRDKGILKIPKGYTGKSVNVTPESVNSFGGWAEKRLKNIANNCGAMANVPVSDIKQFLYLYSDQYQEDDYLRGG